MLLSVYCFLFSLLSRWSLVDMFFALWQKEGSGARSAPPGFVDEGGVWLSDLRSLLSPRSSNERLASPGNGDKLHRRCVGV